MLSLEPDFDGNIPIGLLVANVMRETDGFFYGGCDRSLYHYTGVGSLLGIAESKSLWASNVYFLNDSKEIVHACDVVKEVVEEKFLSRCQQSDENEFLRQFLDWVGLYRNTTYNLFVFSLSEVPSLLSQWRSYTPHGKGVSIEFSPSAINALIGRTDCRLAKCLYQSEQHEGVVRGVVDKLLLAFRMSGSNIDTKMHQCYHGFLERFRGDILQVLAIIKHKAFEEEREWRLISSYYPEFSSEQIKFREGASMLVPYIELPLGKEKPYFESVMLGPSVHANLSMSALDMFLANKGICRVAVNSNIPYREW